jgi:putative glutamine amidotransferase
MTHPRQDISDEIERPIIGVTGPDRGGGAAWLFTALAVWICGGRAKRITPARPCSVDEIEALIVGGGADVDPGLYGQELLHITGTRRPDEPFALWFLSLLVLPATWIMRKLLARYTAPAQDDRRDRLETALISEAINKKLPVLGICRGEQLINVHFGGTLHQSLKGFYSEAPEIRSIFPAKRIIVAEHTRLAKILGRHPRRVNALHQQAIDRVGEHLRVAAVDRNGIVQAVEHQTLPFIIGVQWHPEYLLQLPEQRALFKALIAAALNPPDDFYPAVHLRKDASRPLQNVSSGKNAVNV